LLVFFRLHELAMWIERIEHALERAINQVLVLHVLAVHVIFADLFQHIGEQLEAGISGIPFGGLGAENPCANAEIDDQDDGQAAEKETSFHKNQIVSLPEGSWQRASLQGKGVHGGATSVTGVYV